MYQRDRDDSMSELTMADLAFDRRPDACPAIETGQGRINVHRLAGWVVGLGSVAFLLIAASSPPKEIYPAITMAVPEKPAKSNQIILDWPTIDELPIRQVATANTQYQEDHSETDGEGWSEATEGSAKLGIYMWLADIEEIAGLDAFSEAVRQVGLETLIQPDRRYTLWAPSNAAFAKLGPDRIRALYAPGGHEQLRALLSNHIIEDQLLFDEFAGKALTYKSLGQQEIDIKATDVIKVGDASMTAADFQAANTVIHVIDDFLTPIPAEDVETVEATVRPDAI